MSEARRLRRQNQRLAKQTRKIDWLKVRRICRQILLICVIFFLLMITIFFCTITSNNNLRKTIAANPRTTTARITSVSFVRGRRSTADFEFEIDNKKVVGKTLTRYDGKIGDEICVEYLAFNPTKNRYCHEKELETLYEDCFLEALKLLGMMLFILPIYLLGSIVFGNKKLLAEVTSKSY